MRIERNFSDSTGFVTSGDAIAVAESSSIYLLSMFHTYESTQ
jgi:hypothetical protein